ncbi:MAG: TIGR00730 family Rossman fold protein [Gammaproteobacteria bacterium]|nr:TIGR00730 family Rossman fold protein [Gammaproteobacteria bacterium]
MTAITVFCGSSEGVDPIFAETAGRVGREIARRGWTLVYGGGSAGLLGVRADAALAECGTVIGVIPRFLYEWEVGHDDLTELEIVETLTERKVRMGELADAFLSLPGGIGTMDELFEALSWAQLGLEEKPNGLLNVRGYYDDLVAFLDRATASGFIKAKHRSLLHVSSDPVELLDRLGK